MCVMKNISVACLVILITLLFSSCEKSEGPGGTSTIAGKIWVENYYQTSEILLGEYWAEEEDVYLIYGNDTIYSDDTKTNYDGTYRFQYLNNGTYTIFAYSDDTAKTSLSPSGRIPIMQTVTIKNQGSTVIVPDITIRK